MAESEWITRSREWDQLDPRLTRDLIAAARDGATLRLQAMAAGISFADYRRIRELGRDGVHPFVSLFRKVEQEMYEVARPGTLRKKEIMQSPDATLTDIDTVVSKLVPEDYPERNAQVAAAAGGMVLNINMQKDFQPYPTAPALPDPTVVDAELVE